MSKVKLLLYCTKNGRPLVWGSANPYMDDCYTQTYGYSREEADKIFGMLNGKIVAECDCDKVEEIVYNGWWECYADNDSIEGNYFDNDLACLSVEQMKNYLGDKNGYALYLSNLKIFDETKELEEFYKDSLLKERILKAPQNMCKAYDKNGNKYILVSIRPEWLCKILNGEKTIEIRKQIVNELKEMM